MFLGKISTCHTEKRHTKRKVNKAAKWLCDLTVGLGGGGGWVGAN